MRLKVDYLSQILKEKQWTMRQFAMKAEVSPATVSRVLNHKRGAGAKVIGRICKALPDESMEKLVSFD